MQITDVTPYVQSAKNCLVLVETDEGLTGIGQGGITQRGAAIGATVEAMRNDLIGEDPRRIEHLWQRLFRGAFFPGGVVQAAAVSAVDIALWDLKGKALGVPVYELMGGLTRDRVRCYPHVGGATIDELVADCESKVAEGYEFVRWGLADPTDDGSFEPDRAVRHGIDQVRAVREVVGEEVGICVDVHTRLTPPAAVRFCNGVEPYDPFFVEDPLRSEDPNKLQHVRSSTTVPLAVGEQYDSKWTFREAIEADLMDYCRVDVTNVGGLTEAMKIANWCETHYIPLTPHNPGSLGAVATAASLHLCLAAPNVEVLELGRAPMAVQADLFPTQAPYESGSLYPTNRPGLGLELDRDVLETNPDVEMPTAVGYTRTDGAYTNW